MADDSNKNLPPPPYKVPMVGADGRVSQAWAAWVRQLQYRVGGNIAKTNVELEEGQQLGQEEIQALIDQLNAAISSIEGQVIDLSGINQGRAL